MPSSRLPQAVLWDLDGTLVDTEPYWFAEERALVEEYGGRWNHDDAMAVVGLALLESAAHLRRHTPVTLTDRQIVDRLVEGVRRRVAVAAPWRPGARELLVGLRRHGVPCALVTMSWRPIADIVVQAAPAGAFAAVVTGDMVGRGKPDPEPYLTAARLLRVPVERCVAIEDSSTGARSAVTAGAATIVVPNVAPVPALPPAVQLATLAGVAPEDLMTLVDPVPSALDPTRSARLASRDGSAT